MKIRNPQLLRAAGWLAANAVRGLVGTLRVEQIILGPTVVPWEIPQGPRYAYAIWHENLLVPAAEFGHPDLAVLISKHADGQLLGSLIRAMGMGMIEGSSTRGGVEAVRKILTGLPGRRHLVVTPDGPRGPRRVLQPGIIYAASRAGFEIVPIGVGFEAAWRAKSWDRFAIPRPGSRVVVVSGTPMTIAQRLKAADLEAERRRVQAEMERIAVVAEQAAARRKGSP